MRSDRKKNTDPKRDIEDFLSKFEEPEDSKEYNNYSEKSEEPASSTQNFIWQEIKPANQISSINDKSERLITKDPALSAIKVQRINNAEKKDSAVNAFPMTKETASILPSKSEAVEPEKAKDTVVSTTESAETTDKRRTKKHKNKKRKKAPVSIKNASNAIKDEKEAEGDDVVVAEEDKDLIPDRKTSAELLLDEMFGDSEESSDEKSEVKDLPFTNDENEKKQSKTKKVSVFKNLFSFMSGKNAEPVAIRKEEDIDFIEELTRSESESEPEPESVSLPESESVYPPETVIEEPLMDSITDSEAEVALPAAAASIDLLNTPKNIKSNSESDYVQDPITGEFRKTDLGKRKRIEYIDKTVPSKKGKRKKEKKKKEKKTIGQVLFLKKNPKYDPTKGEAYEFNGKKIKNKPFKFSFLKLIRDFAFIGLLMVMIVAGIFGYIIYKAPVFDYDDLYATVATSSVVYNDEGKQIDNIYYTENRRIVKYEDMPQDLIDSFVSLEDKTFWTHHGFNWIRMVGAVFSSITGHGQIRGTSTITQQLARNIYLPEEKSERSITRKVKEMYYAARIEHAHSKEEIIEAYLNTIYLGFGCYGVNSAAKTYYSKSVKNLDLIECASLAALPQSPDIYALLKNANEGGELSKDSKVISKSPDKIVTNDNSRDRRDLTLDLMLEQGLITKKEYNKYYGMALNDFINPTLKSTSSNYAYFHDYLIETIISDLMEQYDLSYDEAERKVYTGGLQIYSTVDSVAQKTIVKEFKNDDNFPFVSALYNQDYDGNILNNDGKIALYDYDDYFDDNDNFKLSAENGEIKFRDDGSAVINKGHNLYIYETEVDGAIDYSIEFKNYYIFENNTLYSTQGGYVNIPSEFKSGDGKGNVIVSSEFFVDDKYKESFVKDGDDLIIKDTGYSLGRRTRQPQAAMVIVRVGTGEVKAMVGGRQFNGEKLLNRATGSRQPGSSIKPLAVYGAALQKSYELAKKGKKWEYTDYKIDRQGTRGWGDYVTVHSSIEDERTKVNGKYWPKNASGGFSGTNNFRTAIQNSINTCAVKLLMQVGAEYALKQVRKFGITTAVDAEQDSKVNDVNSAAMALGAMTNGVTPLEMALAYAAFPGGGKVNTPICYTKVVDRNGKTILEGKSEQKTALNKGVAWIMTDVLQKVVSRGICWGAAIDGIDVGGKTGTTNDEYDIWFDGFTPSYAAALWIGTDNNIDMGTTSFIATTTWSTIMSQIPKALEGEYRKQPNNVIEKWGDYYTEGTEIGLSSWSYAAEKKKARAAAYKKWSSQRSSHRKWVVDKKPEPITKKVYIDKKDISKYADKQLYKDKKGIFYEVNTGKMTKEEGHWEYEKGWRDGDFSYKFDGKTYTD